jgi:predicted Zn-dependent protease
MPGRLIAFTLTLALLLVGCVTTGPGGKKDFIIIPTSQEVAIGASMAEQVENQEKVLADSAWQNYVSRIGQSIVAVSDRQDIEYRFTVIESEQINAFAAPGGYIYFYTGLLKMMENEGELAAVMAHEISHVVARHGIKRLQAAMGVQLAYQLVFGEDPEPALNTAVSIGLGLTFAKYSRDNEREADRFGVLYMVKAGYNPSAAVTMFDKLAAAGDAGGASVFEQLARSHPETQERINNVQGRIADLRPLPTGLKLSESRYSQMKSRLP